MATKRADRRTLTRTGLASLIVGAVLGITGFVTSPASAAGNDHQITICHATSSGDNPYTSPSPNKWQITAPNGHGFDDGDIIPPFAAGSSGSHTWAAYPGMNWDAEGQAIHAQGCSATAPAAGSVTLDKVTAGDGVPDGDRQFTFSVDCETATGAVPDAAPVITPDDPALTVATGLSVGDSCTIAETDSGGAASVAFSVNDGADAAGPAVVTLATADQVISVLVTNTYECPQGESPDGQGGCGPTDACPDTTPIDPPGTDCEPDACPNTPQDDPPGTDCNPVTDACPNTPAVDPPGTDCNPVTDACPTVDGVQAPGTDCNPVTDACPTVDGVQAPGTDCNPVTDACPSVDGVQAPGTSCTPPVQVAGVTLLDSTPVAAPQAQVGVATLPRTGGEAMPLAQLGFGLMLLGTGSILMSRREAPLT